jgi:hypothetical protein
MNSTRALLLALLLMPCAAAAQNEPEAVYAKFHRAAVSGDVDEMARHGHAPQRAEIASMSAAQKDASAKMMKALLPRAYVLNDKRVNPNGQSARLIVSGPSAIIPGEKSETLYGTISLMMEAGEWKVSNMDWSNTRPAALAQPALKPPATSPLSSRPPAARGATVVGTEPERKLGPAKPPCVYKPVMTAEDVENCR